MWRRALNRLIPQMHRTGVFEPFSQEEFTRTVAGATIRLTARDDRGDAMMDTGDLTGANVWGSGLALVDFLERHSEQLGLRGAAVLELGSGTGLVGMSAAALGARSVTLSDRVSLRNVCSHGPDGELLIAPPVRDCYLLDTLERNADENRQRLHPCELRVVELEWGCEAHLDAALAITPDRPEIQQGGPISRSYDFIVGSDLTYSGGCVPALLYSIKRLSSPHTATLLAIPHRGRRRAVAAAIDAFCLAARDSGLETQVAHEERWFTILQVGLTQRTAKHI